MGFSKTGKPDERPEPSSPGRRRGYVGGEKDLTVALGRESLRTTPSWVGETICKCVLTDLTERTRITPRAGSGRRFDATLCFRDSFKDFFCNRATYKRPYLENGCPDRNGTGGIA